MNIQQITERSFGRQCLKPMAPALADEAMQIPLRYFGMKFGDVTSAQTKSDRLGALRLHDTLLQEGAPMSEEQPGPQEQEVIQYAEEVDQELAQLRVAVWDLIDDLDATEGFVELEARRGGDGPVVRLCRMTSKPLPPKLKAWLEKGGAE